MDVSNREEQVGSQLIETVVSLTGMPSNLMQEELGQMIDQAGHRPEDLTLDQLREAMLNYLETLQAAYIESENESRPLPSDAPASEKLKLVSD